MNSHWYLQFQPDTTAFILVFSLFKIVTPFSEVSNLAPIFLDTLTYPVNLLICTSSLIADTEPPIPVGYLLILLGLEYRESS